MSNLATVEDIYYPIYENGKIKDFICENFTQKYNNGIKCQCTNKIYKNKSTFKDHIKTNIHNKWIENYKFDGMENPIKKIVELKKIIKDQRSIIIRLENEKSQLLNKIVIKEVPIENLLDI